HMDCRAVSPPLLPAPRAPAPCSVAPARQSPDSSSRRQTSGPPPAPAQNISVPPPPSPDSGTPRPKYSAVAHLLPEPASGPQPSWAHSSSQPHPFGVTQIQRIQAAAIALPQKSNTDAENPTA